MVKKKKPVKTSKWSSLQWSKVDVNIGDQEKINDRNGGNFNTDALIDEDFLDGNNHYDSHNKKFDFSDLDGGTSVRETDLNSHINEPGFFFGLEVIDGSQYELKKTKLNNGGLITELLITDSNDNKDIPNEKNREEITEEEVILSKGNESVEEVKLTRKERRKQRLKAKRLESKMRKRKRKEELRGQEQEVNVSENIKVPNSNKSDKSKPTESKDSQVPKLMKTESIVKAEDVQLTWSATAGGIWLHPTLCAGLAGQSFSMPTPIQASTLPASILGKRDIVGAAPTGSGKTLAYALPILHNILSNEQDLEKNKSLKALVLCPTRELAMQVTKEFDIVCQKKVGCSVIVGGLSEYKQKRVLNTKRPPVLVATPGRLWELISSGEHPHLNDLSQVQFLVIDEADRMIKQGSFPELNQIFDALNKANPPLQDDTDEEDEYDEEESEDGDRMMGLQGIRGEAKVTMLDDKILNMIELQRQEIESSTTPKPIEMDDDEYIEGQKQLAEDENSFDSDIDSSLEGKTKSVHRQTFIFSATLALPPSSHYQLKHKLNSKSKRNNKKVRNNSVEGAIAEILEKACARGQTKVVDLTSLENETKEKDNSSKGKDKTNRKNKATKLPPGLSLYQINCTQKHKDSHLYAFLTTTKSGSSGPCLVFCNSIAAVKRVTETLKILGLPVMALHAQMQQKARMKAVESLKKNNNRSILIATDVAARGLDISSVTSVVHYDVARAIDTFIHRAGRTARGVGESAVGSSISLVSASEDKDHKLICEAVCGDHQKKLQPMPIDGKLLSSAQERVSLATKIVSCENVESKAKQQNKWFTDAANEAGLDLDDDLLEGGLNSGNRRERQQLNEAKRAKEELRQLLSIPMRKQAFGKFLSGVGLQKAVRAESEVKPFLVQSSNKMKKKKRRRLH